MLQKPRDKGIPIPHTKVIPSLKEGINLLSEGSLDSFWGQTPVPSGGFTERLREVILRVVDHLEPEICEDLENDPLSAKYPSAVILCVEPDSIIARFDVNEERFGSGVSWDDFEALDLQALRNDLKKYGVIHPITLEVGNQYTSVLDGHKRLMAAVDLELTSIPARLVTKEI